MSTSAKLDPSRYRTRELAQEIGAIIVLEGLRLD